MRSAASNSTRPLVLQIREQLMRFINRREKAYDFAVKAGHSIPMLAHKRKCIEALRRQLEASATWGLQSHVLWICYMRSEITALLPHEFHDNKAMVNLRKNMLQLLTTCQQLNKKNPQLTITPVV